MRSLPQATWVYSKVDRMPGPIAREMLLRHGELVGTIGPDSSSPFAVANRWLWQQQKALLAAKIWHAFDEDEIRDHAENYARLCADMPQLARREDFALSIGIQPPAAKFLTDRYEARAARLADPLWWRRKLRVAWTRSAEEGVRRLGMVRKGKAPYVSDSGVDHRRGQKRRMRDYCEAHVATNELGEQLGLFDVQQKSIANPTLRRGEFMTRVRGFEELAATFRHEALFFTLTVPSHYHPQLSRGGANPAYDPRQTVRKAQEWLCKHWARFRAAIHRRKILLYGFRIAEPHHDGTPHWHGLLFCRATDIAFVTERLRAEWLKEFGDHPGAREHRVSIVGVDPSKGSAAGYIAKYVAKNIDGAGSIGAVESDETGGTVNDGVVRVDAWSAIHGIRQFQQIGGPPVGLWRECRRIREEEPELSDIDLERCRRVADRGDWRGFCRSVTDRPGTRQSILHFWKEETGEVNKYGECRGARTVGLRIGTRRVAFASPRSSVITRPHQWKIHRKGRSCGRTSLRGSREPTGPMSSESGSASSSESSSYLGPVAITVRSADARQDSRPRQPQAELPASPPE